MGQFKFEVSMFFPDDRDKQEFFDDIVAACEHYGDEVEIEEI